MSARSMPLSELVRDLPLRGAEDLAERGDVAVSGVQFDSRRVQAGDLFVAWPGERFDGRRFAGRAVEQGAVAIVAHAGPPEPLPVPWLEADDPRRLLGALAARVHGHPDRELTTVGVTGTNGKTTTVFLVAAMLEAAGRPCGTLGTLGYAFHEHDFGGERTTPEGSDLFRILRAMRDAGAEAAAFEVSSHALDQGRVDEARFDAAVFTNLTRDHFDYHGDFEPYFAAKRRLFGLLEDDGVAVVWRDDAWGRRLRSEIGAADLAGDRRVLTYGESATEGPDDIGVVEAELDHSGIRATVLTPRGELRIESPLLGRYNLWNLLGAVAVGEGLGLDHEDMRRAFVQRRAVPGRLERVEAGQDFLVLVDYAHTDGALEATLRSVRSLWPGRLMVVFGCGGNRDQGKRPLMGRAAAALADLAILTDDNPRDEDPEAIHRAVLEGMRTAAGDGDIEVIGDREQAIRFALEKAAGEDDWAVVIAGKGHESGQTVGHEVRPFSDHDVAVRILTGECDGADDHD